MKRKLPEQTTGVLEERTKSDGRRRLSLNTREKAALRRQKLAEQAALLFLDITTKRSWPEMANELGISVHALKELVKSSEFDTAYNLLFPEVGHDPRYRAAKAALSDMVPTAILKLQEMLDDPKTPKNTLFRVIDKILETNQIDNRNTGHERSELMEFLQGMGIVNIGQVNIIPESYARELAQLGPSDDIVEGELVDET